MRHVKTNHDKEQQISPGYKMKLFCIKNTNRVEGMRAVMAVLFYICFCVCLTLLFLSSFSLSSSCKLWRQFHLNGLHKTGDVNIGGLFEVHYTSVFPEWTFTSEPLQPICTG